jgi:RNA polymerase sigma factor (sigma-70 family)
MKNKPVFGKWQRRRIVSTYLGAAPPRRRKYPVTSTSEEVRKYPISQANLAQHLGQNGEKISSPIKELYLEALHEQVCNLVYREAARYSTTCPHLEVEDMVNDCWYRIIRKLHLYDANKARFTTWVVKVSSSVLSKTYHKGRKLSDRFTEITEGDHNRCSDDNTTDGAWKSDFRQAIELLQEENPERADVVYSLFYDEDGDLRTKPVFKIAAEECGISAQKVSDFYHEVVKPFFYETFEGDYCNE